ncbi:hypothetical protein FRC09_015518 [Ceratobasidium sp. 395]|nr:hypothetical protein FRC09_015518 [Ceratobasidium sp. 395]
MNSNLRHNVGSRDPAPGTSSAPPGTKQGTKRKIRDRLTNVGVVLGKGVGVFEFGPWKAALDDIGELMDTIQRESSSLETGETLVDELDELLNDVSQYINGTTSPAVKSSIEDFAKGVRTEIEGLRDKRLHISGVGRLGKAMKTDDKVKECYRRVKVLLSRLSIKANVNVWKTIGEEATKRLLKTLPESPSAKYCSTEAESLGRGECTPNTRVELLEQLRAWACDDQAQKIYWLNGMAGTGKTTIAYSLCEYLQSVQKLGASFFCSQRLPECRAVNRIVPSISYRLSLFSVPFRQALASVLQDDEDAYNQPLQKQFNALFAKPLRETIDTFPANVVIVIDALDECDDQGGVAKVLTTLLSHVAGLPVKFFVTSRPEPKIVDQMRKKEAERVRLELRLHELKSTVVRQDIATYLTAKLAPAQLSNTELNILVLRSGVLFIYAATVVRFLEFDNFSNSTERLKLVLNASATSTNESDKALDDLYTAILETGLEPNGLTRAEKASREMVLKHVVCAREPLSMDVMAGLLQANNTTTVSTALRPLQSVLSVSESGVIGTLHESFPNYLLNHARSGKFYCDPRQHYAQMAQQCFALIRVQNPPFNICELESSYLLDHEVPDLDQRVERAISQALAYACRYWAIYLELADHSEDSSRLLYEFLSERLPLWMEVMNLKKQMWEGVDMLRKAQTWCKGHACSNDLQRFVQDASRFVSMVVSGWVLDSISTPHIYITALASWPRSRPVSKCYLPRFSGLVKVAVTSMVKHEFTPATLDISGERILGLAYSSDGEHIVCLCRYSDEDFHKDSGEDSDADPDEDSDGDPDDGVGEYSHDEVAALTIWNIRTGQCEASFEITQTRLSSIVFAPNGLYVVLGCVDGTVYIWDTQTCKVVGDALKCYSTYSILSIACSLDGDYIAAGSGDSNVYIWNRHTGQITASLPGHTGKVLSVTYSPDGAYIASGSSDRTIRIWGAPFSQILVQKLSGHTGAVKSVAFSPNGVHVASGSADGTIRIWDVRTGDSVRELLEGHNYCVNSVQYSPCGLRLVSGSNGAPVCIWDPLGGRLITKLGDILGPTNITWVSYSPDSAQVLASSDLPGTLYSWDPSAVEVAVQTCFDDSVNVEKVRHTDLDSTPVSLDSVIGGFERIDKTHAPRTADKLPEGHQNWVSALAYSPDGACIVSGSLDYTLRVWDARTGKMVGQPLEGHTGCIDSVSFTPNGTRIVSGSKDKTIRIWDVSTCTMFGSPLVGHADRIKSVSYSPDGAHIASGSYDKTIRIWNAYTGQMVQSPLLGHTDWVHSVSYSPDGDFLVSGSSDKTVRIWNTRTGQAVGDPLKGHVCWVASVAYSPDGLYIVSRAEEIVCVWDACTRSMIEQPLVLDRQQFHSMSYLSTGVDLSLHYLNGAIHISHTHADRNLVRPFEMPYFFDNLTRCVFSPDGTQVTSGYGDGAIRVSSIHIRQVLDAEMNSHSNQPCAIEPCTCSICASHSDWGTWELDPDGWVVTKNRQKLIWVPVNLRKSLQLPYNTAMMSRHGTLQLDFRGAKLGERWFECYTPQA